jgi:hypothetical protein
MAGAMGQTALSLVGTKCSVCDDERSTDSRTGKHCRTSNDDGGGSVDDNVKMDYSSLLFQTRKPECVTEVYNEYKGIGNYDGYPIIGGGLEAVEKKTNQKWRKNFASADLQHFSWVVQLVQAVECAVASGDLLDQVLNNYEEVFKHTKKSMFWFDQCSPGKGPSCKKGL